MQGPFDKRISIKDLFATALEQDSASRSAFLHERCEDAEICFEVDSFTEDVVVGVCVYALGLKFLTQNEPGDAIASAWKGLAAPTLPELAARGCSIIHSLKDHPPFQESETRDFFRARRLLAAKM